MAAAPKPSATRFEAEDFLDEVRHRIRRVYGSQGAFAREIPVCRNVVSRVVNSPDRLDMYWVNTFAERLGIDLRDFLAD